MIVLLALVYFVAGKLGLMLAFVSPSATAVWPPTGIALAALLILGYRLWPGIFLGAFLVNVTTSGSVPASLLIALGNTLEPLMGAYLVNRFADGLQVFNRPRGILQFVLLAGMFSPAVSATIGVTSLTLNGLEDWHAFPDVWLTWWFGDVAGALIVGPVLILWANRGIEWSRTRIIEGLSMLAVLLAIALIVFGRSQNYPLEFLALPVVAWAAFRLGQPEAVTASLILAGISTWGTLHGIGPFAVFPPNEALLLLQVYMATVAMIGLLVATVVSEQRRAEASLRWLATIVDSSNDAIIGKSLDGTIQSWNQAAQQIYGYSAAEAIGRPISILAPPERPDEIPQLLQRISRGERIVQYETERIRQDGKRIDVSLTLSPIKDRAGNILGDSTIARDITERKRAETALRQTHDQLEHGIQERTRSLVNAIGELKIEIAERQSAEDALRESKSFLEKAQEVGKIGSWISGLGDDSSLRWSRETYRIFGIREGKRLDVGVFFDAVRPDDRELVRQAVARAIATRTMYAINHRIVLPDGRERWVFERADVIFDAGGRPTQLIGVVQDVTGPRQAEERFKDLLESAPDAMVIVDVNGVIRIINSQTEVMFGYRRDELYGQKVEMLIPERFRQPHLGHRANYFSNPKTRSLGAGVELFGLHKDGREFPVDISLSPLHTEEGMLVTAAIRDITERKRADERIRYLAEHDALTELPNRVMFQSRMEQAMALANRNQQRVAILFLDLDDFKHVNDSLGHHVGDQLLQGMVRRLQSCLREGDSLARIGGDEFVIGFAELKDDRHAMQVAGKILEALRHPFLAGENHVLYITGSIGISLYPSDGRDVETLMRAADTAMYHAKAKGRNNYQFFTPSLNEAAHQRLAVANRLHQGLEQNEFVLHYQPQLDLQSKKIISAEALVRWQQPETGLIMPNDFIRIAEEAGLIDRLGEWVLHEACAQLKRWHQAGHAALRIAVNVSPYQFRQSGFPTRVERALRESGLVADALELELTEGILTMQSADNLKVLTRLADIGVRLAIDDFGTGYSSLAYLKRFPMDTLKIDQSFVAGIGKDANDAGIVQAIIAMAASLHLKVIAEGVETEAQMEFLKLHGCPTAQGYYFSKAVPADAFMKLLQAQT